MAALTTWFYHTTELRIATSNLNETGYGFWSENVAQQRLRLGARVVDLFNRN